MAFFVLNIKVHLMLGVIHLQIKGLSSFGPFILYREYICVILHKGATSLKNISKGQNSP